MSCTLYILYERCTHLSIDFDFWLWGLLVVLICLLEESPEKSLCGEKPEQLAGILFLDVSQLPEDCKSHTDIHVTGFIIEIEFDIQFAYS